LNNLKYFNITLDDKFNEKIYSLLSQFIEHSQNLKSDYTHNFNKYIYFFIQNLQKFINIFKNKYIK